MTFSLPCDYFLPNALSRAPVIREGHVIKDLSMPAYDWSSYDAPTYLRRPDRLSAALERHAMRRKVTPMVAYRGKRQAG